MVSSRPVAKIFVATPQSEGVGAKVRRSIGSGKMRNFDPFLLLDEFSVRKPAGFPDHPHRGQQTVTYMLEGAFEHKDNKGHSGVISVGDIQWMTAGRGIVHSEMPGTEGNNVGLQLWVNLAAKDKMSKPQYQELRAADIPTATSPNGDVSVKVVAGRCYGIESGVFTVTPTMFWDVRAKANATFEELLPPEYNSFVYVLEGSVLIGSDMKKGEHGTCAILGGGESVVVKTGDVDSRFVVISGMPHNEPIVQHGPFVMNSNEEIMEAFRDFSSGKFD